MRWLLVKISGSPSRPDTYDNPGHCDGISWEVENGGRKRDQDGVEDTIAPIFGRVTELVEAGKLRPFLSDRVFDAAKIDRAHEAMVLGALGNTVAPITG
jgi:hypothetical protein